MAVKSSAVSVGTSAALLPSAANALATFATIDMIIQNLGSSPIYIGGADVAVDEGIEVSPNGGYISLERLAAEDEVYAIAESGTQDVRVLERA